MVQRKTKHTICVQLLFLKSYHLRDNVEKFSGVRQATDVNMAHELCMLDTEVYKHTLIICSS